MPDKFTVRTGTLCERSHIPLHKWLLATHLVASSKKGMTPHQLFRMLALAVIERLGLWLIASERACGLAI
jgi:hypothetical protein